MNFNLFRFGTVLEFSILQSIDSLWFSVHLDPVYFHCRSHSGVKSVVQTKQMQYFTTLSD